MGDLSKLTQIIESFDSDRTAITNTIKELEQREIKYIAGKVAILDRISINEKSLERERDRLVSLDDTIKEVKEGYNKIMQSTKMLLDIVSTKNTSTDVE